MKTVLYPAKQWKRNKNEMALAALLLVLCLGFAFLTDSFLKTQNVQQILKQSAELGIIVLGMSASIISGGFDLSIGALTGLNSVILASMLQQESPIWQAVLAAFTCSLVCGALNGVLIGTFRLQPMVITLGTSTVFTGIGTVISEGHAISDLPEVFLIFHSTNILGIPIQFWIFLAGMAAFVYLFQYTKYGRQVYLLGSSYDAAGYSGIPCRRCTFWVYVFSSVMAFLAAVIMTSRMATGRIDFADNYVMQSVSAAVFGGISVNGGKGGIFGAAIGVLVYSVLSNAFNLLGLSRYLHQVVIGVVLLIVLGIRKKIET